jgi:hypothetical protein
MLGGYDSRLAGSRDREQVERFREIAKMETQPRARARLLELAEQYERLGRSGQYKATKALKGSRRRLRNRVYGRRNGCKRISEFSDRAASA